MRRQRNLLGPQGMGGMVSLWGASSLIRSIQRGTMASAASSYTATITAVDVNNTRVVWGGSYSNQANTDQEKSWRPNLTLTNSTTLTVDTGNTVGGTTTVAYEVIEYEPGVLKSIQRGSLAYSSLSSGNLGVATITAVNMSKAGVDYLNTKSDVTAVIGQPYQTLQTCRLTAATSVSMRSNSDPNGSGLTWTQQFQVWEFY